MDLTFEQQLTIALAQGGGLTLAQISVAGGKPTATAISAFCANLQAPADRSALAEAIRGARGQDQARETLSAALRKDGWGPALEALEKKRGG